MHRRLITHQQIMKWQLMRNALLQQFLHGQEWMRHCRFFQLCVEDADVTITHLFAGKTYIYEGWIDTVESSQGAESPASVSFTVIAGPPRIV